MKSLWQKSNNHRLAAIAACLASIGLAAQSGAAKLQVLSPGSAEALLVRLRTSLPKGTTIQAERTQAFQLLPGGLTIVPVVYSPHGDSSQPTQCGAFLGTTYLPLINQTLQYTDMCQQVEGATMVTTHSGHPQLLLLFDVNSGHGADNRLPVVLTWNDSTRTYQRDTQATAWLTGQPHATTLSALKRLLTNAR